MLVISISPKFQNQILKLTSFISQSNVNLSTIWKMNHTAKVCICWNMTFPENHSIILLWIFPKYFSLNKIIAIGLLSIHFAAPPNSVFNTPAIGVRQQHYSADHGIKLKSAISTESEDANGILTRFFLQTFLLESKRSLRL